MYFLSQTNLGLAFIYSRAHEKIYNKFVLRIANKKGTQNE